MAGDYQDSQYDDIIHLPHPTSRNHPRMSLENRAAQFSPFAALTGHDAAIRETARQTDEKQELSEDMIARLNETLQQIQENPDKQQRITITYFVPDEKKSGGAYVSHSGIVKRINAYEHTVIMADDTVIPMEQIRDISFAKNV